VYVAFLGSQLQQLVLPGQKDLAAAALQDLQEQQQQLQQALTAALWRLDAAFKLDVEHSHQLHQQLARGGGSSSSSSSTDDKLLQCYSTQRMAALQALVGQEPPGTC
jgi:hypothetical protein